MNLWIITVNFGDTTATKSLIDSLSVFDQKISIKVGIADNETSVKTSNELNQIIKTTKIEVSIFPYKKNLYYWPAAKKVINSMKESIGSYPDWIIICNNDITFPDKLFFKILKEIDKNKFPIIGPNIVNSNGNKLNPFMVYPMSWLENFYWKIYFLSYPLSLLMLAMKNFINPLISRPRKTNSINNKKVYAVHGSAILFSNYFFKAGGLLDDNFEMFGEELTVAEIARGLDLPVTFVPHLKIYHFEHNSTRNMNNRLLFDKAKESHKYFISTYLK